MKLIVKLLGVAGLLGGVTLAMLLVPSWHRASVIVDRTHVTEYPVLLARAVIAAENPTGAEANVFARQLAKAYVGQHFPRSRHLKRQLREVILSQVVTWRYSDHEILNAYLDRVYLGPGVDGVENGARTYFGKTTQGLNAAECAFLAALIRSPSVYLRQPGRALERRNVVLHEMLENRVIDRHTYVSAVSEPLRPAA